MSKNAADPPTFTRFEMRSDPPIQGIKRQTVLAKRWGAMLFYSCIVGLTSSGLNAQTNAGIAMQPNAQNLLTQAARGIGATQCLPAIERLSASVLTGSRTHEVLMDWDRKRPATAPIFSLIGIDFQGSIAAASITAVPQTGGECVLAAERISMAPYTCSSIAQVELEGYRVTTLLPIFKVYTAPGDPGASVSLIDAPPSCLIIRRHVQYGWRDAKTAPSKAP